MKKAVCPRGQTADSLLLRRSLGEHGANARGVRCIGGVSKELLPKPHCARLVSARVERFDAQHQRLFVKPARGKLGRVLVEQGERIPRSPGFGRPADAVEGGDFQPEVP
jgi:hypothetical protein